MDTVGLLLVFLLIVLLSQLFSMLYLPCYLPLFWKRRWLWALFLVVEVGAHDLSRGLIFVEGMGGYYLDICWHGVFLTGFSVD
jgi:hypothetical protein